MKFYDLHIQPVESSIEETIKTAELLGYYPHFEPKPVLDTAPQEIPKEKSKRLK